jgi:hypothetical protein
VELKEERTALLDSRTGFDSRPVLHPRLSWRKLFTQSRRSTQLRKKKRKDAQQIRIYEEHTVMQCYNSALLVRNHTFKLTDSRNNFFYSDTALKT